MNKEELLKEIMKLPKIETVNPISTMNSINVDDLMNAVDRLNKVPDYNDLLKENQQLKMIIEEYERLNKEKYRGFKIIDVQEYDRYELLSYKKYKDNWDKLKEYIRENIIYDDFGMKILDPIQLKYYMQELEGSDKE